MYVQSMTNASSRLPRSFHTSAVTSGITQLATRIASARAGSICPVATRAPKIVEDHSGSSDMIQSIDANVVVTPSTTSPGPLIDWARCSDATGSSMSEQRPSQ